MDGLTIFLILLALGFVFGKLAEGRHYRSIQAREEMLIRLPVTSCKKPMGKSIPIRHAELVHGHVVISVDYFKQMLAGLRNLFGGTIQAYETPAGSCTTRSRVALERKLPHSQ